MEQYCEMLASAQLSIISAEPGDLDGVARTITPSVRVGGCDELAAVLRRLAACCEGLPARPRTLDLFGHSTARDGLLRLGDRVIDAAEPAVVAWFRALADAELLPRLGIRALRLLACRTAATHHGRATICALADILGVEVYGTPHLLYDAHHDAHGFRAEWAFLLVGSHELARTAALTAERVPRTHDVDALSALVLSPRALDVHTLPAPVLGPRTRDVDALPAMTLGPRALDVDALPAMALGPRALDVDALPAITLGPRALDVDALPAPVLSPRALDVHTLPAPVLGPRTRDVDALPAITLGPCALDVDALPAMELGPRALDVDALPAMELGQPLQYPRRTASPADARRICALLDPSAGAPLAAAVVPLCEIVLPTACPGAYHLAEVLYGGAFLQLYPDGGDAPGVAFPVTDAAALLRIVDELPIADAVEAAGRAAISG